MTKLTAANSPAAVDTRPIEGPISVFEQETLYSIARNEATAHPTRFTWAAAGFMQDRGLIEYVHGIYYRAENQTYHDGYILTGRGLEYLADYTIVPLYSAAPDNEFCIGPLSIRELAYLNGFAANESLGTPTRYAPLNSGFLEDCGFVEYVRRLVWQDLSQTFGGGYIVTEAGLAYLADVDTHKATPADPISDLARGRVVMAMECSYWRGLYGDPGPFAGDISDLFDELIYWRKTRGMPPVNAVPALDKLINDQIDFNPPLAAQLGLERR
jgi:hypothetical protein